MQFISYLNFNGDCRQAFERYHEIFGGESPVFVTPAEMPMEGLGEEWEGKILNVMLNVNGQMLMGSDTPADGYLKPQGMTVAIQLSDPDEAKRIFNALADGGTVSMPLEQVPWATLFGEVTDKFNIPWLVNCEAESNS